MSMSFYHPYYSAFEFEHLTSSFDSKCYLEGSGNVSLVLAGHFLPLRMKINGAAQGTTTLIATHQKCLGQSFVVIGTYI